MISLRAAASHYLEAPREFVVILLPGGFLIDTLSLLAITLQGQA